MNWKRIGRAFICLLVVCCLIVNISPLKARATAVAPAMPVFASVPGLNVVAAILIGLGVLYGVATTDWDAVLNRCSQWLTEQAIIDENGNITIFRIKDPNGGVPEWFVNLELIELIRKWLFDEEVLTEFVVPEGYVSCNGIQFPDINTVWTDHVLYPYGLIYTHHTSGNTHFVFFNMFSSDTVGADSKPTFAVDSDGVHYATLSLTHRYILSDGAWVFYDTPSSLLVYEAATWVWSNFNFYYPDGSIFLTASGPVSSSGISSSSDVSLGEVASPDTAIADGYTTWAENVVTIPGESDDEDDYIPVWPIGLNQTWEDTRELTQADVWAGVSTYEDTTTDTETDTESGVITGTFADTAVGSFINSLIDALMTPLKWLADTILAGIQAIFVPSEDFLTAKVNALRARFGFANSIMDTGQAIGAALTDFETSPPIIYMELGNAESKYDWGDRAIALDLRWYERYKPTVDVLLSALLWIFFAWRVFRKLPDIISGVAGDTPESNVSDGRFILTHYASDSRRLTSGSLTRRK